MVDGERPAFDGVQAVIDTPADAAHQAWFAVFEYARLLAPAFQLHSKELAHKVGSAKYGGSETAYYQARQVSAEQNLKRFEVSPPPIRWLPVAMLTCSSWDLAVPARTRPPTLSCRLTGRSTLVRMVRRVMLKSGFGTWVPISLMALVCLVQ